jgi:UDP-2,4-diacetamido-2,4,6-trideoxy-beta-L-altropyranose hydrolase
MRCLTLADYLRRRGGSVSFISRDLIGNLGHLAELKGFTVHHLPYSGDRSSELRSNITHGGWLGVDLQTDAEETKTILRQYDQPIAWLIVDHYALDHQWETQMRIFAKNIMVIDDIADRPHDCDVLLDQNLYQDMGTRYDRLIPAYCRKLLGPDYALLRSEFQVLRRTLRNRDGSVRRILIYFGGGDPTNETTRALDAVLSLNIPDISIDVIVGGANPHREQIKQVCSIIPNTNYYQQTEKIAELMVKADLAVGAGGSTTWERCCLGLPSVVYTIAENQVALTIGAVEAGAVVYLGKSSEVSKKKLAREIQSLINNKERLRVMSHNGLQLVDGAGVAKVVTTLGY